MDFPLDSSPVLLKGLKLIQDMLPLTEAHFEEILQVLGYGKKWCQGSPARDAIGGRCLPHDDCAYKRCINGAIAVAFPMNTKYRYFTHQQLAKLRLKNDRPINPEEDNQGRVRDLNEVWPTLMDELAACVEGDFDWRIEYGMTGPKLSGTPKRKKAKAAIPSTFAELAAAL